MTIVMGVAVFCTGIAIGFAFGYLYCFINNRKVGK